MTEHLKVLISAFACSPSKGSEEGVGWGWVNAIAQHVDVWVITSDRHRVQIEGEIEKTPGRYSRIKFLFVPWHCPAWLDQVWPPTWLAYYRQWQKKAYHHAQALQKEVGFDLVHLVTYVGFRVPGHLWKLDVPFVWGPIGGLDNTPWRLLPMLGLRGCVYFAARNIINSLHKRFLRLPKKAFAKAAGNGAIIAATSSIQREIKKCYGVDSQVICEVGPPPDVAADITIRLPGEPLRIAWSGLHQPAKALPLLLRALAQLPPDVDWRLDILGRGECTVAWKKLACRLGLDNRCTWHGWEPRNDAVKMMHSSHVFVITSIKDLTSTVLLEALSQGVPVICFDFSGFSDVVDETCGIKIPLGPAKHLSQEIQKALVSLWTDEGKRRDMAGRCGCRLQRFAWEKKASLLESLYRKQVPDKDDRSLDALTGFVTAARAEGMLQ